MVSGGGGAGLIILAPLCRPLPRYIPHTPHTLAPCADHTWSLHILTHAWPPPPGTSPLLPLPLQASLRALNALPLLLPLLPLQASRRALNAWLRKASSSSDTFLKALAALVVRRGSSGGAAAASAPPRHQAFTLTQWWVGVWRIVVGWGQGAGRGLEDSTNLNITPPTHLVLEFVYLTWSKVYSARVSSLLLLLLLLLLLHVCIKYLGSGEDCVGMTAVSRTGDSWARVGWLVTASAAFSHYEGKPRSTGCRLELRARQQPHTHAYVWRSCTTEVSISHGESFLALGFDYPLFYSLQSRHRYPTQFQDS